MNQFKGCLSEYLNCLIDIIFLPQCILCHTSLKGHFNENTHKFSLCQACLNNVMDNTPPFCRKCSRTLKNPGENICLQCQRCTLHFDQAYGALQYNEAVRKLLHTFKYAQKTKLRHYFSQLLLNHIVTYHISIDDFHYIVPIPLHSTRLRERGFNQSVLISQLISQQLNIPHLNGVLLRCHKTLNQARLSRKNRWTNIRGAFKIKQSQVVKNKNILLVDDLLTTGSTASEAARVLKEAGAVKVSLLTVAVSHINK